MLIISTSRTAKPVTGLTVAEALRRLFAASVLNVQLPWDFLGTRQADGMTARRSGQPAVRGLIGVKVISF
jgi:hypothetical protein